MKKRFLPLALALGLSLALALPALATERMKGYDYGDGGENYTVEQALEAPNADVVLLRRHGVHGFLDPAVRDYELWLCWEGDYKKLILPSTVEVEGQMSLMYPTDRAPDSLTLNEDGSVLTYVYSFGDALFNADGELLHDVGTYTYTVDTATGELAVTHEKDTALPSPALGAEGTTFVDVSPEDWFAPYVDVCVEAGLMKGVGEGRFDPQGVVTMAEAATIAARIHHIKNGGDGNLPKAPEEWGRMTLTFEDGETFSCYQSDYDPYPDQRSDGWFWSGRTSGLLYFTRREGWDGRDYQRVSLKGWESDIALQGQAEVPNNVGTSLRFDFDYDDYDDFYAAYSTLRGAPQTPPTKWYRDTDYYLVSQGLGFTCGDYSARRYELVTALDKAVGSDLTPINHITDYPDAYDDEREMVLRFYNAGILTGTDAVGSFSSSGFLTRAEVAAMAARILKPELRLEFSLEAPVFQSYTLTPLEIGEDIDPSTITVLTSDLLRFYLHDQKGNWAGTAILRADGTVLELPEGASVSYYPNEQGVPYPLLALSRDDMAMPGGWSCGVLDPLTGEMVVPFGPYAGYGGYAGAGDCAPVEGGRHILTKEATWDRETWMPTYLRDDKGNILRELPERDGIEPRDWTALNDGLIPVYDPATELWGYRDMDGKWAISPRFEGASPFHGGRAIVSQNGRDGVIDAQGREVISCEHYWLERRGDGLYRTDRYAGGSYWLREDGGPFRNGYLNYDTYLCNGYFALGNRYLDKNFQYATPAVFDWTGPISSEGSGFVGMYGKVYRIQFEK